jgi:flagellar M-ring protein FliF
MVLAVAGLLQGTEKGFEIFDSMSMGATSFVQNVNYMRAIQGELAKTIMTLEPIQHARVHIVQPEPTPFVRDEQEVTASVVVKTRPGTTLTRQGAQAIVALVAASVRGLSTDNVTVLDADGRVLSERKKSPQAMAATDQLAHQLEVESHLANKAQEILTRLLGPGRAVVRVTADMSFRHVTDISEKFDPDGKVVVKESVMSSKSIPPLVPRGPAGTATNLPPGPPNAGPVIPPSENEEVIDSEYVVSRLNHAQEEQQENINRLTVAVMLMPPKPVDEVPLEESLGITPAEASELVKQSIGFKEGRDKIQVSIGKPAEAPAEAAIDQHIIAFQQWQNIGSALKASSLGIAALSLLVIGLLAMRRKSAPSAEPALATSSTAGELDDLHAVAGTIRAWLEEAPTIRMDAAKASGK